uniref:Uncharacterized protein n=1 Tax=Anabas testudineus TaxID=64144 RepID=A0A3Q1JU52_ANATE
MNIKDCSFRRKHRVSNIFFYCLLPQPCIGKILDVLTSYSSAVERLEEIQAIPFWQESLLCHYTMDRLFSFSILTARVFAVGDPSGHTEGSAQRCM